MKINYSDKTWCYKLPETEEEWNALATVFESLDVNLYDVTYSRSFNYIFCSHDTGMPCLVRIYQRRTLKEVSFYEMINILTMPKKTEQEIQIEQLENTIKQAAEEIQLIKAGYRQ
jgi:hypothetical protein